MNPPSTRTDPIEYRYPGSTDTINQARVDLVGWLRANGLDALAADAELVVSELTSNAVEASPGEPYTVAASVESDAVRISVSNPSTAELPADSNWAPESVLAPQGRGLFIVKALSESVDIEQTERETIVSAKLPLPRD